MSLRLSRHGIDRSQGEIETSGFHPVIAYSYGSTENAGHEIDGHETKGQDIILFENKLHHNAVCNFLKQRQNTSHNSKANYIICICIIC